MNYTYKDWYEGKVVLRDSLLYDYNISQDQIVDLNQFKEKDRLRIIKYQKKDYEQQVKSHLKRWMNLFVHNWKMNNYNYEYVESEKAFFSILNFQKILELTAGDYISIPNRGFNFKRPYFNYLLFYLKEFKNPIYFHRSEFIPSPNTSITGSLIYPQIYAGVIYEFAKWLDEISENHWVELRQRTFNPSQWTVEGLKKFEILVKHYNNNKNQKYRNIWYFFREEKEYTMQADLLMNQSQYIAYLKEFVNINLSEFKNKPLNLEEELMKMRNLIKLYN
jgi:hypothetical protein